MSLLGLGLGFEYLNKYNLEKNLEYLLVLKKGLLKIDLDHQQDIF
jgi:hypothetical protein